MRKTRSGPPLFIVAGGAGLIGSHLCRRLLADGHQVLCLDSLQTGSIDTIRSLLGHARFAFHRCNVIDAQEIACDGIFNLACPASPPAYQADPVGTVETNVVGALTLLRWAQRQRIPIVQGSTSEVYGDPDEHPQRETYWGHVNPIGVRACYDEGKRCAETLFMDFRRQYGVSTRIARIFNTFGPHMRTDDGRVVSNFIVQALEERPLTIYGDGSQTRSLCYVDDTVDALVRLMHADHDCSGPFNVGNPDEHTVGEIAERILELTGSHSSIIHRPLPADDPRRRRPDISAARRHLDWQPQTPLRQGLLSTIDYFVEQLASARPKAGHAARQTRRGPIRAGASSWSP